MIRNARMEDIQPIYALLRHFSGKGLLLERSLSSLYDQLRDFKVFVADKTDENSMESAAVQEQQVAGVCALHICWDNLAEIRSLAVAESYHDQGVGTKLVEASLNDAIGFGINRVFTLTYQPSFFRRLGFKDIDKNELPHKVWSDCIQCSKFPDCNEEALIWEKPV